MTSPQPGILARGPWPVDAERASWRDEHYVPPAATAAAADAAIQRLQDRGSPSHDGLAARLVGHEIGQDGTLHLDLQPVRWALRLVDGDASHSLAALCVIRDADGRWLAGRRSAWLSTWAGRWALGAGGAVDLGESPAETLTRELAEEWALTAERVQGEALVLLPHRMVMFIGQAWVAADSQVTMDHEHDAHAWWPPDPADWPAEADLPLRRTAALLASSPPLA